MPSGTSAWTSQPRGPGPACRLPPSRSARLRMPSTPEPGSVAAEGPAGASLRTDSVTWAEPMSRSTSAVASGVCLATLARDSWVIRYSPSPTDGGTSAPSPRTRYSTRSPARRKSSTRSPRSPIPGSGRVPDGPAASRPTVRRMSAMAWRPCRSASV
ncbi:hypothetical protein, partial [Actinokineospora sp.]|uniref:hypothetical protein n=1 Tax=Actinokineospora sp. TaxID=1872133 RepID=UPI003D6B9622